MKFPKEFLWGGATAANQYEGGYSEGGKALTLSDFTTSGSHTKPRRITYRNIETGEYGWVENRHGKPTELPEGVE